MIFNDGSNQPDEKIAEIDAVKNAEDAESVNNLSTSSAKTLWPLRFVLSPYDETWKTTYGTYPGRRCGFLG